MKQQTPRVRKLCRTSQSVKAEDPIFQLEIQKLTYQIAEKAILDGCTLNVGSQEIHALLGFNGSGKSTLAYVVMGCDGYAPHSGQIRFDGADIGSLTITERAKLGIALAWQEPARFKGISVYQFVILGHPDSDPSVPLKAVGLSLDL